MNNRQHGIWLTALDLIISLASLEREGLGHWAMKTCTISTPDTEPTALYTRTKAFNSCITTKPRKSDCIQRILGVSKNILHFFF